jgi:hypothetical protein
MKTKYILAIVLTAIVTLSFTFISSSKEPVETVRVVNDNSAPVGGLAVDDSF